MTGRTQVEVDWRSLPEQVKNRLEKLPPLLPRHIDEAKELHDSDAAAEFFMERISADRGKQPTDWESLEHALFVQRMRAWRELRLQRPSHEDRIRSLAARHNVYPPFTAETLAILVVRMATAAGEEGFRPEPPPAKPKALLHAWICTSMAEATANGAPERQAAKLVHQELRDAGYDMAPGSIVQRWHEQKRIVANADERVRQESGLERDDEGLRPRDAILLAVTMTKRPNAMESAAVALIAPEGERRPRRAVPAPGCPSS